ncbi:Mlp family lipoprotein, partial [Borreliella burgdorferi]
TSLKALFTYTIEKLYNDMQECSNGNKNKCEIKCNNFFNWLSTDIQKQKELAQAFAKVYNFLESKRKLKEKDKDFDTYIKGAIDCKANTPQDCKNNKYGDGDNLIEQYFRGVTGDIFNKNSNEEIYKCLKDELLNENNHYAGLTTNWQN